MESKEQKQTPKVGIVCGGGGFTAETLLLVKGLNLTNYRFIIAGGLHFDSSSISKIGRLYPEHIRVVAVENPTLISVSRIEKVFSHLLNIQESFAVVMFKKFEILFGVGSYLCFPLFLFSKLKGIKCIYLESYTRIDDLSATGKLIYKLRLVENFYVLHKSLYEKYPRTILVE